MTIAPLAKSYTRETFTSYLEGEVTTRLTQTVWRPRGVVLHNTGKIGGPGKSSSENFYYDTAHQRPLDGAQRVRNMWQSYVNQGWQGGPHLILTDREIWTGNPLWLKGTHSPSWNATFWGMEMAGDFDIEPFPPALRALATHALAALYSLLGHEPSASTFHLHKEDPATMHKRCPGKNAGLKDQWIADIATAMRASHPGTHPAREQIAGV
jgi:hypothetical protein